MNSDLYDVKFDSKEHQADGGREDSQFIVELVRKETGCDGLDQAERR